MLRVADYTITKAFSDSGVIIHIDVEVLKLPVNVGPLTNISLLYSSITNKVGVYVP